MLAHVWHDITPETEKGTYLLYFPATEGRNSCPEWVKYDNFPVHYPRKPTKYMIILKPNASVK